MKIFGKKWWLFTAILISVVLITIYFIFFLPSKPPPVLFTDKLGDLEIKAFETFMERGKLLISLATALIGAIGLILVWQKRREIKISNFQKSFLVVSAISAGFSIYLGYVVYSRVIEFLSNKMFNLFSPYINSPISGQFWAFLISILCFMIFAFYDIFILNNQQ